MKKLKSRRGETIAEGLVSILIVVLCFGFLTTAVITSERITSKMKARNAPFHYYSSASGSNDVLDTTVTVKVTYDGKNYTPDVNVYHVKNSDTDEGYWYYEK